MHKSDYQIYALVLNSSLGCFLIGYQSCLYNSTQESISFSNGWTNLHDRDFYEGSITAALSFGGMYGCYLAKQFVKLGRVNALIYIDFMQIFSTLLGLYSGFDILLVSRLITGICVGMNSVIINQYIGELVPDQLQAISSTIQNTMMSFGCMVSFFFGLYLPLSKELHLGNGVSSWRWMFGFPILICLIRINFLLTVFDYDTPLYLLQQNKKRQALNVIQKIYKNEYVNIVYNKLEMVKKNEFYKKDHQLSDLLQDQYRKQLLIGCVIMIAQSFSGIGVLISYSTKIFQDSMDEPSSNDYSFYMGTVMVITSIISASLIDKYGRKQLILIGQICSSMCLFWICLLNYFDMDQYVRFVILGLISSNGIFSSAAQSIYISEILPENGIRLVLFLNYFFDFIINLCFPQLFDSLGMIFIFILFFLLTFTIFFFFYNFLKETKEKSQEEILNQFTKSPKKSQNDYQLEELARLNINL